MRNGAALKLTSCQAQNSEFLIRALAAYLAQRLGIAVDYIDAIPWKERERLLYEGEIHAGWICGLPYVLHDKRRRPGIELLAAPARAGVRYRGRPVYFSDVVVRHDSAVRSFEDLRGARWGYNEPGSHSGYNLVRYQLAELREYRGYFGHVVATGAHQTCLKLIADGALDAAAVDSTVFDVERRLNPSLRHLLRVVTSWGPSPAPPLIVTRRLPTVVRRALRNVLVSMHREAAGRALLRSGQLARFAAVADIDYQPIRHMAHIASRVTL